MPQRAERPRTRAQAQPSRIEEGHDAGRIAAADPGLRRDLRVGESREPDALAFKRQKQADLFALSDCQRPESQHFRFPLGQDDPFPPALMYDGARPVSAVHFPPPPRRTVIGKREPDQNLAGSKRKSVVGDPLGPP
jgi:hypothetical protein